MTRAMRIPHWLLASLALIAGLALAVGCDVGTLLNQTATFGPSGAGAPAGAPIQSGLRGTFRIVIENNTPFRAIFTTGVFDNTDERTTPVFTQFSPDSRLVGINSAPTLEANSSSGVLFFPCARVFSVGSRSLLNLIDRNPGAFINLIDETALLDGVGFSSGAFNSPEVAVPREGFAAGFEAELGVDFNCGSLLHVTLEFADTGPDRVLVDLAQVVPAGRDDQ